MLAFTRRRAQIRIKTDQGAGRPGGSDRAIATALSVGTSTVQRARAAFAEHGFDAGLETQPMDHPRRARKQDGAAHT